MLIRRNKDTKQTHLSPRGITFTHTELYFCARNIVIYIRQVLGDKRIIAEVWPYKEAAVEQLVCELFIEEGGETVSVNIETGSDKSVMVSQGENGKVRCVLPNMSEAIHLVGIITTAINAQVAIRRLDNEQNIALLKPLSDQQHRGHMNLNFERMLCDSDK